jgi:hypothetical protein
VVSDEVAAKLVRHPGDLSLHGVKTMSAMAADTLAAHAKVSLPATVLTAERHRAAADGSPLPNR